jgi:hypothetical protein
MTSWMLTVGSWEPRFLEGFKRSLDKFQPAKVLMYFYNEYAGWSARNRHAAFVLCSKRDISVLERALSFTDYNSSWLCLYDSITKLRAKGHNVVVDITTMPRETIWSAFDLLESHGATIHYVYYEPRAYNKKWLSRDPAEPRLVYKLSGESKVGLPTNLLVLTGYDVDRIRQLIRFFEPQRTFLGLQTGEQLDNQNLNVDKTKMAFSKKQGEWFDVDAYSHDHGFRIIAKQLEPHFATSNIIMSSLGPKLSAIALYRLHKLHPQTSLAYTPSNEFNRRYSAGIGQGHDGSL